MTSYGEYADKEQPVRSLKKKSGDENTPWESIYVASSCCFIQSLQYGLFSSSLWPYLKRDYMDLLIFELDPSVSESFFGYIVAVYSLGQCVSSPVFGYWSNRIKQVRVPTIFGLSIVLLGNLIYILIKMLPTSHGYAMAISRALIGIGSSNGVLLRAYASMASTPADRSRAIGCVAAGISIGLVIGPGLQALFTPLGEDGVHLLFGWSLHIYNAPAFLAATINVSGILLIYFLFEEKYAGLKEDNEATTLPPPDFVAVGVCIVTRFTQLSVSTNIET
ncbi:unnamed protein product [Angiostrongylus costaricensis]|uniref:MFS domain-containing protein n=1 Tax=Angiostrongylus costaricensis TaxID=334426 RepID=A0A0R3PER0_ANGCS|nr:unnamed protein product [Angiostrongylus costaricensis]